MRSRGRIEFSRFFFFFFIHTLEFDDDGLSYGRRHSMPKEFSVLCSSSPAHMALPIFFEYGDNTDGDSTAIQEYRSVSIV